MFPPQGTDAPAQLNPDWLAALVDTARAEYQALVANSDSLLAAHAETAPEQLRAKVSTLCQGTAELERYVQNLLLLAAFRREEFRFQLQPTALDDWLDEVLPALRPHVEGNGQTLHVVRRGALPEVMMDRPL